MVTTEGASVLAGLTTGLATGGAVVEVGVEVGDVLELEPPTLGTLLLRPVNATDHVFDPPPIRMGLAFRVFPQVDSQHTVLLGVTVTRSVAFLVRDFADRHWKQIAAPTVRSPAGSHHRLPHAGTQLLAVA